MSILDDLLVLNLRENPEEYMSSVDGHPGGIGFNQYSTQPNIFGGFNLNDGHGHLEGQINPNIFGGHNITDDHGHLVAQALPNIFGGHNINEF